MTSRELIKVEACFQKKYNPRMADRCCANCKFAELHYDGMATCKHPEREYFNEFTQEREFDMFNVSFHDVCDGWMKKPE